METTAVPNLLLLGTPSARDAAENELRQSRSLCWKLLARLSKRPESVARTTLCDEFETTAGSLQQALQDCKKLFKRDVFASDAGTLRLLPGIFSADTALFRKRVMQSDGTEDIAAKIAFLQSAFDVVRGKFLEGCSEGATDWVGLEQRAWDTEIALAGRELTALWEEQGHLRQALDVARRLAEIVPEDAENRKTFLRLTHKIGIDCEPSPDSSLAEWIDFIRILAKKEWKLTLREHEHWSKLLSCECEKLSSDQRMALKRLCILEGSFDSDMAAAVCEVSTGELFDFVTDAFLTEHAGRYEMPILVRDWIRGTLPESQKTTLQTAYHQRVITAFHSKLVNGWHVTPVQREYWKQNLNHLDAVLCFLVGTPAPTPEFPLDFTATFCMRSASVFLPHHVSKVYALFDRRLAGMASSHPLYSCLQQYSGRLASAMRRHATAAQHFQKCLAVLSHDETLCLHSGTLPDYLHSLHHSGEISEAVAQITARLPALREHQNANSLCELLHLHAESLHTLGRFQDSYDACTEALELAALQSPARPPASILYHQGMALVGMALAEKEYTNQALAAFDASLESFTQLREEQGQADCWQQMGKIYAQKGQVNTGERMVNDALRLYASSGKEHSHAACLRSLGDVLKLKGDWDGAKTAYCEGLEFWENEVAEGRHGSGWVARFQERLESLEALTNSI